MQHISTRIRLGGAVLLLCLSAPVALADALVNMTFTGTPSGSMGGYYTNPYAGTVNGAAVQMICDDYHGRVGPPSAWTAVARNFQNIFNDYDTQTGAKFTELTDAALRYKAVGWLALQLFDGGYGQLKTGQLSYALWDIFSGGGINVDGDAIKHLAPGTNKTQARSLRDQAFTVAASTTLSAYSSLTVYTAYPTPALPGTQEFIVKTPEPSAVALLALDMSGLLGLVVVLRRRFRRPE